MQNQTTRTPDTSSTPATKKRPRWVLRGLLGLVVLLAIGIALVPTIASSIAPGMIASAAGKSLNGSVQTRATKFSWGGPQVVEGLVIKDSAGTEVAKASVEVRRGLLGLALSPMDLGEVRVRDASVRVVRKADGSINLTSLAKQDGSKPAQAAQAAKQDGSLKLPKGLRISLSIESLDAQFIDEASAGGTTTVTLDDLKLKALVDPIQDLTLEVTGTSSLNGTGAGSIKADLRASQWADAQGVLTLDRMAVDGTIAFTQLPTAMIDAFVPAKPGTVALREVLGTALDVNAKVKGTLNNATADLSARADRATVAGVLSVQEGVASTQGPLTISMLGSAIERLAPQLMVAKDDSPTTFTKLPDVSMRVDGLKVRLPKDGTKLDLRGASATIDIQTTQASGTVKLPGQAAQALVIEPLSAKIVSTNFADGLSASARTRATLGGRDAGQFTLVATARSLLDDRGSIREFTSVPDGVDVTLSLKDATTAIAQPFVSSLGLDLTRDIGPTMSVNAHARSVADATGPEGKEAAASALRVDFDAGAENLTSAGTVFVQPTRVYASTPVWVEMKRAGALLAALTREHPSVRVSGDASSVARVEIPFLDVGLLAKEQGGGLALDRTRLQAKVSGSGLRVASTDASIPAMELRSLDTNTFLLAKGRVALGGQAQLSHEGTAFSVGYDFKAADVIVPAPGASPARVADVWTLRPTGVIEVGGLPASVLKLLPKEEGAEATAVAQKPLDLAALVRGVVGPQITVTTRFAPVESDATQTALTAQVRAERLSVDVRGSASESMIDLAGVDGQVRLTPASLEELLRQFAPTMDPAPRLSSESIATLRVESIRIPLGAGRTPEFARAGDLKASVRIPEALVMENLTKAEAGAANTGARLERLGLRGFSIDLAVPVSSLVGDNDQKPKDGQARATLAGEVLATLANAPHQWQNYGTLGGTINAQLRGGKPGVIEATMSISGLQPMALDPFAGGRGLLASALGGATSVQARATISPAARADGTMDIAGGTIDASASIDAPHIKMKSPLAVRILPGEIVLAQPVAIDLWITPEFARTLLTPASEAAPTMTLAGATGATLKVRALRLPRATPGATPAPMSIDVEGTIPGMTLSLNEAAAGTQQARTVAVGETKLIASTTREGNLGYQLGVQTLEVAGAGRSERVSLDGLVRSLRDASGGFSMERAVLDAKGSLPTLPTHILDALARQDGLLVDALGDTIALTLDLKGYPLGDATKVSESGTIDATFTSPRARASVSGDISDATIRLDEPASVTLTEITTALSGRLVKGLPLVGSFEKSSTNAPALIRADTLALPLDKDMRKLTGSITIDPGEASFATSGLFNELLNLAKIRTSGMVGRRLEPLTVTIDKGVATYPKWTLPLGDFSLASEGRIDLVAREVDVITWVPLGALSDELMGSLNTGLGAKVGGAVPVLEAASLIPIRTKGSMDKPGTSVDFGLLAENTIKSLNPVDLIDKGLQGIGDLFKKKDK